MYTIVLKGMVTGISEKSEAFQDIYDIPNIIKLYQYIQQYPTRHFEWLLFTRMK